MPDDAKHFTIAVPLSTSFINGTANLMPWVDVGSVKDVISKSVSTQ